MVPSVSKDQSTSSTVTGLPSENRAPSRRVNSTKVRASSVLIDSAKRPYKVNGSSKLRAISVSKVKGLTPSAGLPPVMNGFSVSKLPLTAIVRVPPFGASGFT